MFVCFVLYILLVFSVCICCSFFRCWVFCSFSFVVSFLFAIDLVYFCTRFCARLLCTPCSFVFSVRVCGCSFFAFLFGVHVVVYVVRVWAFCIFLLFSFKVLFFLLSFLICCDFSFVLNCFFFLFGFDVLCLFFVRIRFLISFCSLCFLCSLICFACSGCPMFGVCVRSFLCLFCFPYFCYMLFLICVLVTTVCFCCCPFFVCVCSCLSVRVSSVRVSFVVLFLHFPLLYGLFVL